MSEQIREQLSALLDGELPAQEQSLLLARLARDPDLRARWSNYQLIGDGLRKGLPAQVDLDFADRVMRAIDDLPAQPAGKSSAVLRVLKPLVGLAVAASVAVVAVLAVQQSRTLTPGTAQVAINQPAQPEAYARVQGTRWQTQPGNVQAPQVDTRLNEYLVNHSEYATSGGMPGMLPYVRVVGYDQE